MQNIIVPALDITQEIIIASDHDKAGIIATEKLANRLLSEGYIVKMAKPLEEGWDFNNLLLRESNDN